MLEWLQSTLTNGFRTMAFEKESDPEMLAEQVYHGTLHPTPSTLNPQPYTPNPKPYTLHPTPYTLHPKPQTLNL